MDLWSKGLGRLVLGVRLSERSELSADADETVIRGTMGAPVYWDYAVRLDSDDVIDFTDLLKQRATVGFLVTSRHRWQILGSALHSVVAFAWAMAARIVGRPSHPVEKQERKSDVQHRS